MPYYSSCDDSGSSSESSDSESSNDSFSEDKEYDEYRHHYVSKYYRPNDKKRKKTAQMKQPSKKTAKVNFTPSNTHGNSHSGVYVMKNTHTGMCYVGKSENIPVRIQQHIQNHAPGEMKVESTITIGSTDDLESWERNEVLTRMYRHGMDNVRGWRYTHARPLTMDEKISARNDIMEKFDLCRRCGHNNHFVDKCFARSPAFWCKDIPIK